MSMKCITLRKKPISGIDQTHCLLSRNPPAVKNGLIMNADLELEVMQELNEPLPYGPVFQEGGPFCFLLGLTKLCACRKQQLPFIHANSVLVEINMCDYFCDPLHGDHSALVSWYYNCGLFLCQPKLTAITRLSTGTIWILNDEGKLQTISEDDKPALLRLWNGAAVV